MEGDINCQEEEDINNQDGSINIATRITVEIAKDKEIDFGKKLNIVLPKFKGQCLNTKDFQLVKKILIDEINKSLNPTDVINRFLNHYSDIINSSQEKQLMGMINS